MLNINSLILASDAGVWYAFANSDGMGKAIVFLLFLSSMVAWFIMIEKGLALYRSQKLSERFAFDFDQKHSMHAMLKESTDNPCPVAKVYISGMQQLLDFNGMTIDQAKDQPAIRNQSSMCKLSPAQLDAVQTSMEREISGQIFVIEERIGMLATAVSLAPFLGLFGTVWGVMIAFCGVASAGSANIQALAPGVAGALLTTVAGLLVAIPSLVGYNFLTQMIRKITVSMDNFSESFMARLKLEQLVAKDPVPQSVQSRLVNTPPPRPAASIPANRPLNQTQDRPGAYSSQSHYPANSNSSTMRSSYSNSGSSAYNYSGQSPTDAPRQMSFGDMQGSMSDPDNSMRN